MMVRAVNLAVLRTGEWTGRMGRTGIDKRPVAGPVRVGATGLRGDTVCDRRHHGGTDRAGYAFAEEDVAWWEETTGRRLPPGSFGENLTTSGLDVTGARLGERWAIGSVVFEVSAPRVPCRVFAAFWDVPDLIGRFIRRGQPGAYLRVLTEGEVAAGDPVTIVHRPDHDITVGHALRALTTEPHLLPDLAAALGVLPEDVRATVTRRTAGPAVPA
ncbi:MOSC domain-containing protein, partial [Frankia sp. AgKG'84/4]|uniref:MOSC domain-containing protein n=1 Tax=Frankia sp. AgKG'84/4 TaxID=573490 RepID=UPI0035AE9AE0